MGLLFVLHEAQAVRDANRKQIASSDDGLRRKPRAGAQGTNDFLKSRCELNSALVEPLGYLIDRIPYILPTRIMTIFCARLGRM